MALSDLVGATLNVVARAGHAGLLDNGTGQARPLRSLFPALPRPGRAVGTHNDSKIVCFTTSESRSVSCATDDKGLLRNA